MDIPKIFPFQMIVVHLHWKTEKNIYIQAEFKQQII